MQNPPKNLSFWVGKKIAMKKKNCRLLDEATIQIYTNYFNLTFV